MRVWLLVIGLAACEKSAPAPAPEPAPPDRDLVLSTLAADMVTYTERLPGILLEFDGDCPAHATRLLTLETLVSSIRTRSGALSPEEMGRVRERIAARKTEIFAKLDAQLAEKHATRADVEAKDAAIKTACANEPKVKDAMDRVGLFTKKAP